MTSSQSASSFFLRRWLAFGRCFEMSFYCSGSVLKSYRENRLNPPALMVGIHASGKVLKRTNSLFSRLYSGLVKVVLVTQEPRLGVDGSIPANLAICCCSDDGQRVSSVHCDPHCELRLSSHRRRESENLSLDTWKRYR